MLHDLLGVTLNTFDISVYETYPSVGLSLS